MVRGLCCGGGKIPPAGLGRGRREFTRVGERLLDDDDFVGVREMPDVGSVPLLAEVGSPSLSRFLSRRVGDKGGGMLSVSVDRVRVGLPPLTALLLLLPLVPFLGVLVTEGFEGRSFCSALGCCAEGGAEKEVVPSGSIGVDAAESFACVVRDTAAETARV